MADNPKTEKEALAASIEMEKKGHDFYVKSAARSSNPHAADIFNFLAREELRHIEAIKSFYDSELSRGKSDFDTIVESADPVMARTAIASLFDGFDENASANKSDLDALGFARNFERKGVEFYRAASARSETSRVKKLFDFLADEEERHFKMVDDSMVYFENPEEWFHRREGWHVEG